MKILKNRAVAWIIVILMIFSSILILGGNKLENKEQVALEIYLEGEYSNGMGIKYDLEKRVGFANNLISVAERYLSSNDSLIKDVNKAIRLVEDDIESPYGKPSANKYLTQSCDALYAALLMENLSDKDSRYNYSIKQDLDSHNMIIKSCGYNEKAEEYNSLIEGFPASVIAGIRGISKLDYFE